jgi:hypothetical protein
MNEIQMTEMRFNEDFPDPMRDGSESIHYEVSRSISGRCLPLALRRTAQPRVACRGLLARHKGAGSAEDDLRFVGLNALKRGF